jgi:hypothetical protein
MNAFIDPPLPMCVVFGAGALQHLARAIDRPGARCDGAHRTRAERRRCAAQGLFDLAAAQGGGHLDVCVLGAFQVAGKGDLWVMIEHAPKAGEPEIVPACSYPLTDLAALDITADGVRVVDHVEGLAFEALHAATGVPPMR